MILKMSNKIFLDLSLIRSSSNLFVCIFFFAACQLLYMTFTFIGPDSTSTSYVDPSSLTIIQRLTSLW